MGRTQTIATAILGAWLGGTLFMWFLAGASFSTVERVLGMPAPPFAEATKPLGEGQIRVVLRHFASELNRAFFRAWGWAQAVLGALLIFFLLRQSTRDTAGLALVGIMLTLVLILLLIVTPQMVSLGRSLDFAPRNPAPSGMARFRMLHGVYTGLDAAKLLAGIVLLVRWIKAR